MATIRDQIIHLQKDKILKKVIASVSVKRGAKKTDLYLSLLRAVVGQQLSVKAAQTIWNRFIALFEKQYPEPESLIAMPDEQLRAVGLSYQKISYVKNIADFSITKTLDYKFLKKKENEDLIEYLTSIKGVGRWTVEMILMFNLQREDVFPVDDLGIQNAMKIFYNLEFPDKRILLSEMDRITQKWRPYRTLACMYLWRAKDLKK